MAKLELKSDFSITHAAIKLGVSKKTILKLIHSGELEAYRPGLRAFRITEKALEAFKQKKRVFSL